MVKKGSFKYFIGYINETDQEYLKKYNQKWEKIGNLLKKGLDSKPVYDNKHIKTKTKIYNNGITTNFQGNEVPVDNEYCTYFSMILFDSVVKIIHKYF